TQMGISDLMQHLRQSPQPTEQLTQHLIGIGRLIEDRTRMSQPPQSLVSLLGIRERIIERRHRPPPGLLPAGAPLTQRQAPSAPDLTGMPGGDPLFLSS